MSHHEGFEHHEHPATASGAPCRFCSSPVSEHPAARLGFCHNCMYKILIVVLIVMVAISYTAWFGIF